MTYKYVIRNVKETWQDYIFMPKPIFGDNGSGIRPPVYLEGWKTLVRGDGYAGLSKMALHYIGGLSNMPQLC